MKEIWKDIPGYEGSYQVSDLGRVQGLTRTARNGRVFNETIIRPQKHAYGYRQVALSRNSKKDRRYIHALVLLAFRGEPPIGQECNHIDGDKTDNRLCNLEYCTRSDNHKHAYRVLGKKAASGEAHGMAKLTYNDVAQIRSLVAENKLTGKQIAKQFNVSPSTICDIIKGRHWGHFK